jgi:site-specific DNA-methyltransferase (adenine-specific)
MFDRALHNPDILNCLANLSNDEVFTPPELANQMLDLLPPEIWKSKTATFLDPCTKTGVFMREITRRLMDGLASQIPNRQKRIDHILTKQVFGIAITELTSLVSRRTLYCSKNAAGKYSVAKGFKSRDGNVRFKRVEHSWANGQCQRCGVPESELGRDSSLENYAYEFIHIPNAEEIFKMKFDVIIGNPPYQLKDGGHGVSSRPIYQLFVQQAKKLARHVIMIIPARWYAGGKGLEDFREEMKEDESLKAIVDIPNSNEVFPGVDIAGGVCYFHRDSSHKGLCNFNGVKRSLAEYDVILRDSAAIPIVRKILAKRENGDKRLSETVSASKPFGVRGHHLPSKSGIPCHFTQRQGVLWVSAKDLKDNYGLLDKYKFLIPAAPIAGQTDFTKPVRFYYSGNTRVASPGEACTESWLVAFSSDSPDEVISFRTYLFTKTVRFLLLQAVVSQHVTRVNFKFVPDLGRYESVFTDALLRERWGITSKEWELIDSKIKAADLDE